MRRRWTSLATPLGIVATAAIAVVLLMAVLGPAIWGEQAAHVDTRTPWQPPSAAHLAGTDGLGRDVLARVLAATGLSVGLALLATAIGVLSGLVLGGLPSVLGRRAGRLVAATIDVLVAFPGLLLALCLAVIFGTGAAGAVLAIGLAGAPAIARLTYTLAASVGGQDFVAAARVLGVSRPRLLTRHVLPNIAEPLIINATIGAGQVLLAFASLSFLGLGVQPPAFDWGRLLNEGLNRLYVNPAVALAPGVAVVLAGLAFSMFGELAAKAAGAPVVAWRLRAPRRRPEREPADGTLLRVVNLRVSFPTKTGPVHPVDGVTFSVGTGEKVGIVGESGAGKSLTALALAGLVDHPGRVSADVLEFAGTPTNIATIFQHPGASLNPALTVGRQLAEVAEVRSGLSKKDAWDRAVDRLGAVRIADPRRRAGQYPHELSGGMQQRAMIAVGLMERPKLIIADEPTTALDTTVQGEVLRLLDKVNTDTAAALLLISHDIAVVTQLCDRVLVCYAGMIVEEVGTTRLASAAHPYTRALLAAVPTLDVDRSRPLAVIPGSPPEPANRPSGCPFAPRCEHADESCTTRPPVTDLGAAHRVACWHPQGVS